jgi:peptidoglycan/xylan/chitin deacetylase (PgdA/CDA1 family)
VITYIIKPGDTLYSIAKRYSISIERILMTNPQIKNQPLLYPGTSLNIPLPDEGSSVYPVYNILGSTDKISRKPMEDIYNWRKHIVQFARMHPDEVFINGLTSEKNVSITFDDGPDSTITPAILDIFKRNNIKANFFFLGSQVDFFPNVVRKAYDEGHVILNHSLNHPYFTRLDPQEIKSQVMLAEDRIKKITGKKPAIIRPPYGDVNDKVLSAIRETNSRIIIWSIDSMDWVRSIDKQAVVDNVLNNVRPGDIILMHSGPAQNTALKALPDIIKGLKENSYGIVGLGELLNVNLYK